MRRPRAVDPALEPRVKSRFGISNDPDGGAWQLLFEGQSVDQSTANERDRLVVCDPEHRCAIMREEGIAAECVLPTIGLYVWMLTDAAGGAASCRVYNEWIAGGLARSPRFKCAELVPTWRLDDALGEVRWIAEAGLGACMLPAVAAPEWNHPVWRRCGAQQPRPVSPW